MAIIAAFIIFIFIAAVSAILFGIGVLNLKKELELAKVTGVLLIVAGATLILLVGFIVLIVADFFSIALLWKASKVSEKKKK